MATSRRLPSVVRIALLGLSVPAVSIALGYLLIVLFPNTPVPPIPSSSQQQFDSLISADLNHSILDTHNYTIGGSLSSGLSLNSQTPLSISQNLSLPAPNLSFQTPPAFDGTIKFQPLYASTITPAPTKFTDSTLTDLVTRTSITSPFITPVSTILPAQTFSESDSHLLSTLLPSLILLGTMLISLASFRLQRKHFAFTQRQGSLTVKKTKLEIRKLQRDLDKEEEEKRRIVITDL